MKNNLIIIYLILIPILTLAQDNLVINPSFEEYTELPTHTVNNGKSFCLGWYVPNGGSPDYFHSDCNSQYLSEAKSALNFCGPHSGAGCIGIIPFEWSGSLENISGTLINPLQKGQFYRVSFWVKYAGNVCLFSIDCFGVLFTKEKFYLSHMPFYEYIFDKKISADVESQENFFFVNDSSWVEVNFLYKAIGGEKYFTIGKFYNEKIELKDIKYYQRPEIQFTDKKDKFIRKKKNQEVLLINDNYVNGQNNVVTDAYYFIDDVSVSLVSDPQ